MICIFNRSLLLAIAATTIFLPAVLRQQSPTTTWTGILDARGTELRLEIDMTENAGIVGGELRSLDQGNAKMTIAEIRIDDHHLSFSIPQIGGSFSGTLSGDGSTAEGTFRQGGVKLPLKLVRSETKGTPLQKASNEQLREAWIGELDLGIMKPVMQFRIVTLPTGDTAAYFDSVTEGRTGFEATWSIDGDTLNFEAPKIGLTYRGTLNEARDIADGTWSQGGRNVPLTLKKQANEYKTANIWENRPQRPVEPFPYDVEKVTFENRQDSVTLAGTLTIPQKPGKHPAVILISGSGPSDRDESIMEHKPFLVLADYLTRRGIAVLRYDDRGTAESTGNFGTATTEDFAHDAAAAVEFLRHHDRINPREIGLAGHSEGGLIAPMVVGLRDDVAFIALLAATGVDGATIVESQTEAMLRAAGTDESEIGIALTVNRAAIEVARKAAPGDDFTAELDKVIEEVIETLPEAIREEAGDNIRQAINNEKGRLEGNWMRFFLGYDPRPALAGIKCPVLAINGSRDTQVLPDLNLPEIRKALGEGGNGDFEIIVLDGLNHLFQTCDTGSMAEYITIQETFNPAALKIIGDWIVRHTTPVN
jgi:pimeloyl-ACP methyl ester carboxylesterase